MEHSLDDSATDAEEVLRWAQTILEEVRQNHIPDLHAHIQQAQNLLIPLQKQYSKILSTHAQATKTFGRTKANQDMRDALRKLYLEKQLDLRDIQFHLKKAVIEHQNLEVLFIKMHSENLEQVNEAMEALKVLLDAKKFQLLHQKMDMYLESGHQKLLEHLQDRIAKLIG